MTIVGVQYKIQLREVLWKIAGQTTKLRWLLNAQVQCIRLVLSAVERRLTVEKRLIVKSRSNFFA